MQEPLTVGKLYKDNRKVFKLKRFTETVGFDRVVTSSKLNRPGLELTGFWKYFDKSRIQIIGRKENMYFRTLSDNERQKILKKLFTSGTPAIIFAHGAKPPEFSLEIARESKIALLSTPMLTSNLVGRLMDYLDWNLAPSTIVHGSLVDVFGVGLLLTGRSGIGKSEVALDLVERGHRLVADDIVKIIRRADNVIIGTSNEFLEHHMEVRGLGIVDIRNLFGIQAIRQQKRVEVQVELVEWDDNENYERIGAVDKHVSILEVDTPIVKLPIYPGKNITVIAEVIAMNHLLKFMGKNSARDFEKKLAAKIRKKSQISTIEQYLKKDFE
ncbi:HPr(Ser) kinase/phosphatase [bacterium]|nr:HPr(Ser) kinase/phosphatase [bacterium]MBU1065802.1 HPr(Ser) kinase/phosphatase [bacterium]MBU1635782.1 HPr(Ser) kinase/phosphatase [bacterium]MBU1873390.1 HPr(Ser) kinase/phosphatase [bacterium]